MIKMMLIVNTSETNILIIIRNYISGSYNHILVVTLVVLKYHSNFYYFHINNEKISIQGVQISFPKLKKDLESPNVNALAVIVYRIPSGVPT